MPTEPLFSLLLWHIITVVAVSTRLVTISISAATTNAAIAIHNCSLLSLIPSPVARADGDCDSLIALFISVVGLVMVIVEGVVLVLSWDAVCTCVVDAVFSKDGMTSCFVAVTEVVLVCAACDTVSLGAGRREDVGPFCPLLKLVDVCSIIAVVEG